MKEILISAVALLTSLSVHAHPGHKTGHLKFNGGKIHVYLSWDQGPEANGAESIMHMEWREAGTHAPIEPGAGFEVSLWMPEMGHGSAPTQVQRMLDEKGQVVPGSFQVRNMYFTMDGDWEIRVAVKYQDGTVETQTWSIPVGADDLGGHNL